MSVRKLTKIIPVMEVWRFQKGSQYYAKTQSIRNILMNLSGGNINEMLMAVLTVDEVFF